jgi:AraC-like DNA-binding protein
MTVDVGRRSTLGHWAGRAFLSVGRALYLGPAGDTTPHAHHAIQVTIGLDTPVRLRRGREDWREYDGAIVAPDTPHQLDGGWGNLALFYVEPESADGRRWLAPAGEIRTLPSGSVSAVRALARKLASRPLGGENASRIPADLLECLRLGPDPVAPSDQRVVNAVRKLRATSSARGSMGEIARAVGLSPRRRRHLFRRERGMSAQSYRLWVRINQACAALAGGASISAAAMDAGFSDAAHFTRTFRRTFGLAPSQIAGALTLSATTARAPRTRITPWPAPSFVDTELM